MDLLPGADPDTLTVVCDFIYRNAQHRPRSRDRERRVVVREWEEGEGAVSAEWAQGPLGVTTVF